MSHYGKCKYLQAAPHRRVGSSGATSDFVPPAEQGLDICAVFSRSPKKEKLNYKTQGVDPGCWGS